MLNVTATDLDGDEITYVLGGEAASKFKINNKTGEVFVNAVLTNKVKDSPLFFIFLSETLQQSLVIVHLCEAQDLKHGDWIDMFIHC